MKQSPQGLLRRISAVVATVSALAVLMFPLQMQAGSTGNADLSLTVATTISLSVTAGSSISFGTLTPGVPVTGTTTLDTDTNAAGGYDMTAKNNNGSYTSTMRHTDTTNYIADKTAITSFPGTCNSATWAGTGLGFTVFSADTTKNTTCWGTGTTVTDANNLYAGFSTTAMTIHQVATGPQTTDTVSVGYKLDTATSQKSGAYSGQVQYAVTANP